MAEMLTALSFIYCSNLYITYLNCILQENVAEINAATASSNFINAFQIIAMSSDLDLSGLFEEQVKRFKNLFWLNL